MVEKVTIWHYLEPFLDNRESLHLADISKRLKKPHPTVRQQLNYFEKLGILIKSYKGRLTLYKLNRTNPLIIDYLSMSEKEKTLMKSRENLILTELILFLHNHLTEQNTSLIFGSASADFKKANDIDLLITGTFNKDELKSFEKMYNIAIHLINAKDLNSISETLKEEILKKHLIIHGSEAITKWLI